MSTKKGLESRKHEIHGDRILEALYRLLETGSPNLALYMDLSLLRYPLIKITVVPIIARDEDHELSEFVGASLVELVVNMESLYRDEITLDKDIYSVRLSCEHGWLIYEYTVLKSEQGIPYVSKLWMHIIEGKPQREIIEADREFIKFVEEIIKRILTRAKEVLEQDGYL